MVARGDGASFTEPTTRPATSPTSGAPTVVTTTTAEPITRTRPPTSRAIAPTTAPPPPLSQALLRLSDWRRAGLETPVSAPVRHTLSRCQDARLSTLGGAASTRYSSVTSGGLTGAEAVVQTSTPTQADAILRAVVAWRESCDPSTPDRAHLGTSALVPLDVDTPTVAYGWTFVFDPVTDFGNSQIEQVVLVREGNRVALAVVSREVPAGLSHTSKSPVDQAGLAQLAASRLT